MFHFFLFIFCCLKPLCFAEDLTVLLETEVSLLPTYVAPIVDEASGFTQDYLNSLDKVLRFDFEHNGMTTLISSSNRAFYVINTKVKNKQLSAKLLIVNSNQTKSVDGIALTGNLSSDRKVIHTLSDTLFKALFDKEGVAKSRFLFTVKKQNPTTQKWTSEVYEADYDGANARQITKEGDYCVTPCYLPPKTNYKSGAFAYVSYKNGQPKIYFGSLEDGTSQRFSLLKGNQLMPTISRQRDKVAFISDVTGNPDLFLQDFDPEKGLIGKPRQIYATHKATQSTPTFSPDGKKIAFVSNKDGSPRIYLMDIPSPEMRLENIKARLISKANRESTAPCWSPDGTKIVYCSSTKGVRQIWLYDLISHTEKQLTKGSVNKENPTFAPNSLHILYNTSDAGNAEIYLMDLNQLKPLKITKGEGEKRFPAWEAW